MLLVKFRFHLKKKRYFQADVQRMEEEFRVQANLQKSENVRLQQQLVLNRAAAINFCGGDFERFSGLLHAKESASKT